MRMQTSVVPILAVSGTLLFAHTVCARCADVNDNGVVSASDALGVLKLAVGQPFAADCGEIGGLLSTMQTTCHDDAGATIPCAGSGQDGEHRSGATRAFVDNGNGTITDRVTGLMWEKLADDGSIHDSDNTYTWAEAFQKIEELNTASFAGHQDWRLPNQYEAFSLIVPALSFPPVMPALDSGCTEGCTVTTCSCNSDYLWTSTEGVPYVNYAWLQNMTSGITQITDGTQDLFNARAVRAGYVAPAMLLESGTAAGATFAACADVNDSGSITAQDSLAVLKAAVGQSVELECVLQRPMLKTGQSKCSDTTGNEISCAGTGRDGEIRFGTGRSFTNNGDGTISDNRTGLMWEVLSNDGSIHDMALTYNWLGTATKITALNENDFAGHSDWRVPNIIELHSLTDLGELDPAIHDIFDVACMAGCSQTQCSCTPYPTPFWSSTTFEAVPSSAWVFRYGDGNATTQAKSQQGLVRAVRGGW